MTRTKGKLALIVLAFVVLAMTTGCNGSDDTVAPTATPQVITGDVTADAIIEDTVDAVETGISTLCTACLIAEKLGGDACNCNNICDAEVVCKGE